MWKCIAMRLVVKGLAFQALEQGRVVRMDLRVSVDFVLRDIKEIRL